MQEFPLVSGERLSREFNALGLLLSGRGNLETLVKTGYLKLV